MGLYASEGQKRALPLIEEGVHIGICYQVIDLGTHHDDTYDKDIRQVLIGFELPSIRMDFEKDGVKQNLPRVISRTFNLALGEKAHLYKNLVSWRGKDLTADEKKKFDMKVLIGLPAQLQILHKASKAGKESARIQTILGLPKDMPVPNGEYPKIFFSLEDVKSGDPMPNVPDWIKGIIATSVEWEALNDFETPPKDTNTDDDIPF